MASETLPILIAGAGPCGLVAALTLQRHGVRFRLVEKASKEKLCSNVGSGFDLFPTAVDILCKRLGLEQEVMKTFRLYAGMHMMGMDGGVVREMKMADMFKNHGNMRFLSAKRAELQNACLDALERLEEVLLCGVEVTGYEQTEDKVTVSLSDGTEVQAAALFACDGIHSAVRKHMFADEEDGLHFTGQLCWWGQVAITPDLAACIEKTQAYKEQGQSFTWCLGTARHPGAFLAVPVGDSYIYGFFSPGDEPPAKCSEDLTRRGGVVMDESSKQELLAIVAGRDPLLTTAMQNTPPQAITKVGLFDRANLELPYARGRVALLGDAAHPQSPFMGQGVNMAIVDAYVLSTRCAKQGVGAAIAAYNSTHRRKGVNDVVRNARSYGQMFTTSNWLMCWMNKMLIKFAPISWVLGDMLAGDRSNREFVAEMDKDLGEES